MGRVQQAVTRVTGSGSREAGAEKYQCLSATSSGCWFPKSQSLPMCGGTLMALIHPWPQTSPCKASVGAGSEYPETPLFPSHATGVVFSLSWVNSSCWFHLGLPPFFFFVPVSSCPAGVGQVRSSAFSSAFPCWTGQRAMG